MTNLVGHQKSLHTAAPGLWEDEEEEDESPERVATE